MPPFHASFNRIILLHDWLIPQQPPRLLNTPITTHIHIIDVISPHLWCYLTKCENLKQPLADTRHRLYHP